MQNVVVQVQTVLQICDPLALWWTTNNWRTTTENGSDNIRRKRNLQRWKTQVWETQKLTRQILMIWKFNLISFNKKPTIRWGWAKRHAAPFENADDIRQSRNVKTPLALHYTLCIKKHTNCWGRQNAAPLKFDPKPSETAFSAVFSNFDKYRPEVYDDFISRVAVRVKLGDVTCIMQPLPYNIGICCHHISFKTKLSFSPKINENSVCHLKLHTTNVLRHRFRKQWWTFSKSVDRI